jgi:hypothetical protein
MLLRATFQLAGVAVAVTVAATAVDCGVAGIEEGLEALVKTSANGPL